MANDYENWSKGSSISVEAFPGALPSVSNNTYEKMMLDGNPDATTYDIQMRTMIMEKGYPILFYPYLYEIEKNEQLSGEHSAATYGKPIKLYATLEIKDAPSWIESFGVNNSETFTAFLHIGMFEESITSIINDKTDPRSKQLRTIFNPNAQEENDPTHHIEPRPKDLIQLMLFGVDRPWDRGNRIFEITNVEDEIISENFNNYFGHYVWKLTGVRYRYSYEDMMSNLDYGNGDNTYLGKFGEQGNNQVYDTRSVAKMFLAHNGITDEKESDLVTDTDEFFIATEDSKDGVHIIEYDKVYDKGESIPEQSKQIFDMTEENKGIYDDPVDLVETNGYL